MGWGKIGVEVMKNAQYLSSFVICLLLVSISLILSCSEDNSVEPILEELMVWPQTISQTVDVGGSIQAPVIIKVDCNPHAVVNFSFSCGASWLTLSNMEGTNYATTKDSFAVVFDVSSLPVGTYVDSVVVTSSGAHNSPQYVEVTLEVEAIVPDLEVYPQWLVFAVDSYDDVAPSQDFSVVCADGSNRSYTLEEASSWITLSGFDGETPDVITVNVSPVGLGTGSHTEYITVSSDEMQNSPQTIVCRLDIPPWVAQESPFTQHLKDVVFLDTDRGWAAGFIANSDFREGFILSTDDGGDNWESALILPAGAEQGLGFASISLIGEDLWVVGESGIIYHSEDLGVTWQNVSSGLDDTVVTFNDVFFTTELVGWIVGEDGLVLKTIDGGLSWEQKTTATSQDLFAVIFTNSENGCAVGIEKNIIRTFDGGETWSSHACPMANNRDVWFVDAYNGWIVGSTDTVSITTDGGFTWSKHATGTAVAWHQAVQFVDALTGWVVGHSGTISYTADGGLTWTQQETNSSGWLFGLYFIDDSHGWAVGDGGTILFTTSGGQ